MSEKKLATQVAAMKADNKVRYLFIGLVRMREAINGMLPWEGSGKTW